MDLQINLEGRDESGWNKGSNGYLFSRDETILAPLKALLQIVVVLPWWTTLSNKDSRLLHLSGCRSISSSRDGTTCIVALPVVSYFISPLLRRREGWFIGNGDASSTCLDRKYGELDSQSRPLPSRHSPTRRRRRRRRIISLMKSLSWIIRARVVDTCVFVRPSLKRSLL